MTFIGLISFGFGFACALLLVAKEGESLERKAVVEKAEPRPFDRPGGGYL